MTAILGVDFVWALVAIQILGIISAGVARLSEGSRRQTCCQRFFFALLLLVGLATVVAVTLGPACWLISSSTLSLMVLTVTCDFRRPDESGAWEV